MVSENLTAKNVSIGIIDGGFHGAHETEPLQYLMKNRKVIAMKDFVNPTVTSLFDPKHPDLSKHGKFVMVMVAGYDKKDKIQYGLATEAEFYLAKTENNFSEFRGEEDLWLEAIEWMDSLGVRLVNSSLGYSYDYDDPAENYSPEDMNGHTSVISKAAQMAVDEKGMIIVSSIGNEGTHDWQVITTPSDAKGVIAVGSSLEEYWVKPDFSSIGPEWLPYLKPNITCPSAEGTSFSAPFITGLIACVLERKPGLTTDQVMSIIERSGHLYPYGNNYMGYGLPTADRVLKLADDIDYEFNRTSEIHVDSDSISVDLNAMRSVPEEKITFFFKKNQYVVTQQAISEREVIVLKRKEGVKRTTVASKKQVLEIIWE